MRTNYSGWSVDKLKREKAKLEKLITQAENRDKKKALAELVATARKNGFELSELVPISNVGTKKTGSKAGRKVRKVAPKYQNPADTTQTWTGRGRKPHWVQAWLKKGKTLEDILI